VHTHKDPLAKTKGSLTHKAVRAGLSGNSSIAEKGGWAITQPHTTRV